MKKLLIIFINIILLASVFSIIEFLNFENYKARWSVIVEKQINNFADPNYGRRFFTIKYTKPIKIKYEEWIKPIKKRYYIGHKKGSIVIIGCSYAFGIGLNENQTLPYKLNKYTDKTVYNRGVGGSGPQMVYMQLSDKNFKKEIPEADYIIYVFLHEHISRQFQRIFSCRSTEINPTYQIKNNNLIKNKDYFWFLYNLFTIRNYLDAYKETNYKKEQANGYPLFYKTMEESLNEMRKNYANAKFVMLAVPDTIMCKKNYIEDSHELKEKEIKQLEKMGIIYIDAEELVGHQLRDVKKYRVADESHPNETLWDEVIPKLVKRLNL